MYFAKTNPQIANYYAADTQTRCFIRKIKQVNIFTHVLKKDSKKLNI